MPKTHLVKLRCMKQIIVLSRAGEWGWTEFKMNSMLAPLFSSSLGGAVGTHQQLAMTDKNGDVIVASPQPYGYTGWLNGLSTTCNNYQRYKVLGSKVSLTLIPTDITTTAAAPFLAGFSMLHSGTSAQGTTFAERYANVDRAEVSDMLNCGIIPKGNGGLISATSTYLRPGKTFSATYSHKKWARKRYRVQGQADNEDWFGTDAVGPAADCRVKFIIADMGANSTGIAMHFMFEQVFTVQLSGHFAPAESVEG